MHGDFLTQPHHTQKRTLLFLPFHLKGEMCIRAWFTSVMNKNTRTVNFLYTPQNTEIKQISWKTTASVGLHVGVNVPKYQNQKEELKLSSLIAACLVEV